MARKKKKKISSEQLRAIDKSVVRDKMKQDGAFDGRFRPKRIPNKIKNQPPPLDD